MHPSICPVKSNYDGSIMFYVVTNILAIIVNDVLQKAKETDQCHMVKINVFISTQFVISIKGFFEMLLRVEYSEW